MLSNNANQFTVVTSHTCSQKFSEKAPIMLSVRLQQLSRDTLDKTSYGQWLENLQKTFDAEQYFNKVGYFSDFQTLTRPIFVTDICYEFEVF